MTHTLTKPAPPEARKAALRELIFKLDPARLAAVCGVSVAAVTKAQQRGALPAMWFDVAERLAGKPLDRRLFSFVGGRDE